MLAPTDEQMFHPGTNGTGLLSRLSAWPKARSSAFVKPSNVAIEAQLVQPLIHTSLVMEGVMDVAFKLKYKAPAIHSAYLILHPGKSSLRLTLSYNVHLKVHITRSGPFKPEFPIEAVQSRCVVHTIPA